MNIVGKKIWIKNCNIPKFSWKILTVSGIARKMSQNKIILFFKNDSLALPESEIEEKIEVVNRYELGDQVRIRGFGIEGVIEEKPSLDNSFYLIAMKEKKVYLDEKDLILIKRNLYRGRPYEKNN